MLEMVCCLLCFWIYLVIFYQLHLLILEILMFRVRLGFPSAYALL